MFWKHYCSTPHVWKVYIPFNVLIYKNMDAKRILGSNGGHDFEATDVLGSLLTTGFSPALTYLTEIGPTESHFILSTAAVEWTYKCCPVPGTNKIYFILVNFYAWVHFVLSTLHDKWMWRLDDRLQWPIYIVYKAGLFDLLKFKISVLHLALQKTFVFA